MDGVARACKWAPGAAPAMMTAAASGEADARAPLLTLAPGAATPVGAPSLAAPALTPQRPLRLPPPVHAAKPLVRDLNAHLVCVLCGGYYVDATTIVECLHSFCRSCIVRHLENSKFCPICDVQVHKAKPLCSIRADPTLQTLVYKVVPGLYAQEKARRRAFHAAPPPASDAVASASATAPPPTEQRKPTPEERGEGPLLFFSPEDSVSLSLEYYDSETSDSEADESESRSDEGDDEGEADVDPKEEKKHKQMPERRYLQCPAAVSVRHLQRFVRLKHGLAADHHVDIIHAGECLRSDFTLMDVAYTFAWKQTEPMRLSYRIFHLPVEEPPEAPTPAHAPAAAAAPPDAAEPTTAAGQPVDCGSTPADGDGDDGDSKDEPPRSPTPPPPPPPPPPSVPPASDAAGGRAPAPSPPAASPPPPASPAPPATDSSPQTERTSSPGDAAERLTPAPVAPVPPAIPRPDKKGESKGKRSPKVATAATSPATAPPTAATSPSTSETKSSTAASPDGAHAEEASSTCEPPKRKRADDSFEEFFSLRISSTDDEDDDEEATVAAAAAATLAPEPAVPVLPPPSPRRNYSPPKKRTKTDKAERSRLKEEGGRRRSKHKSRHREEGRSKRSKTHRASDPVAPTPTILQYDEDAIKLKVKLGPAAMVTGIGGVTPSNHHRHHHHHHHRHHKHHKSDPPPPQPQPSPPQPQPSRAPSPVNAVASSAIDSAKERLLQMRAVRHKTTVAVSKAIDAAETPGDAPSSGETTATIKVKKPTQPPIMPPSSITVSKVNSSEKRKMDMQKMNKCGPDNKRPSLEIMLVNAPAATQGNNGGPANKIANKMVSSLTIKTSGGGSGEGDLTRKTGSALADTKGGRLVPPTIPVVRIKKPVAAGGRSGGSLTIRPPSGLTITPSPVPAVGSKVDAMSGNFAPSPKVESPRASPPKDIPTTLKDSDVAHGKESDVEDGPRHDDIGALDLSGKSSRSKEGSPQSSSSESPSPGAGASPARTATPSAPPPSSPSPLGTASTPTILSIAQTLQRSLGRGATAGTTSGAGSPARTNGAGSPSPPSLLGALSPAPAAMSNLKTLSDAAEHMRNLMAAQSSKSGTVRSSSKTPTTAPATTTPLTKGPSTPSSRVQGSAVAGRGANSVPLYPSLQHHQFAVGSAASASPIRIPMPPSAALKAATNRAAPTPPATPTSSPRPGMPRLHELFPGGGRGKAGAAAGSGFGGAGTRLLANGGAKPGPNQGVRHIPNPSATLIFRQQTQQQRLAAQQLGRGLKGFQGYSGGNGTLGTGTNCGGGAPSGATKTSPQGGSPAPTPSPTVSPTGGLPAPTSSIRKMENMTRNIEKVAAGLTVRAVEANNIAK